MRMLLPMNDAQTQQNQNSKETLREFQVFAKPVGALCNLRCRYCYYVSHMNSDPQSMSDELLESYIIQHITACADPVIAFSWHGGEPTLYGLDGFRKITRLQKKHRPEGRSIGNGIQTNGFLLNDEWCSFLAEENFIVGLSLDGMQSEHDRYRVTVKGATTHRQAMRAYELLRQHSVRTECLCVVHSLNVRRPEEVYEFFHGLGIPYLTFLPLVEPLASGGVSERTAPSQLWGEFLCTIFNIWIERGIGRIKIQIFEEAARSAFGQEHTLCIFRKVCGGVPVLECNGNVYSCDHFATPEYLLGNIRDVSLSVLLDSPQQQAFGRDKLQLPQQCLDCAVLDMCNGGCPKNRFAHTSDGKHGLNYLCAGYKRFFTHCLPFVNTLAQIWKEQNRSF